MAARIAKDPMLCFEVRIFGLQKIDATEGLFELGDRAVALESPLAYIACVYVVEAWIVSGVQRTKQGVGITGEACCVHAVRDECVLQYRSYLPHEAHIAEPARAKTPHT